MGLIEFFFPKKKVVTVDMGSQYIKAAHFYLSGRNPVMTKFEMFKIPAGVFENGVIKDVNKVSAALLELLKKKIKLTPVHDLVVSIQGSSIFTKVIQTPNYSGDMLKEFIRFEASQYIAYDLSEVNYSYEEIKCLSKTKTNKNFLFVALNKDYFKEFISLFTNSGFRIKKVHPSFIPLEETFGKNNPKQSRSDKNILILDVGKQVSGFHILKGNETIFSRYFVVGLDLYLEEIQNQLGVTFEEAESLLRSSCEGESVPNKVASIVKNYHSVFCREVSMGLEYFTNYFPNESIEKGFLTGGASELLGLKSELSQFMKCDIETLPIFRKVQTKGFSKKKLKEINSFAGVCVGLALRHASKK